MALKISRLSRLLDFREKKEKGDGDGKEDFSSVEQEQEQEAEASPFLSVPPDPRCLQLPQEHALNQLWRLRREQEEELPAPVLRLERTEEQSGGASEEKLRQELERLRQMVTSTAEARLALVNAKQEQEEAGQEEEEASIGTDDREKTVPDLDAMAEVLLAEDHMAAWLLVYPPVGKGREVDGEMLKNVLREKDVTFGVADTLLERLPEDPERYFHLFLAAEGKQPIHGKDGEIVDLFSRSGKREVIMDAFGNVNYAELDFVHNINEGDAICHIMPPVEGQSGRTVTNKELPAKEGKKPLVPKGRNTEVTEDGSRLIATKTGHVEFGGQSFQVKPVLEISGNVDYSTGNINFLGDVHVSGNICAGFSVKATGSITVEGLLEASTVEAGGDLIVKKGIKGDQESIIRAGRSLYAKYLESAVVCAKEHLESDCIINCSVYSNGEVQVSSGRGILVGGAVRTSGSVKANIVGSRSEHRTLVYLGGLPSEEFELECLSWEIKELEREYEKLERQPDSPTKARKLGMTRMKLSVNRKKQEQFEKYLEEAKKKIQEQEEKQEQAERQLVCGIAYGGTVIHIGDAVLTLNREVRPCTAVLIKDEVQLI